MAAASAADPLPIPRKSRQNFTAQADWIVGLTGYEAYTRMPTVGRNRGRNGTRNWRSWTEGGERSTDLSWGAGGREGGGSGVGGGGRFRHALEPSYISTIKSGEAGGGGGLGMHWSLQTSQQPRPGGRQ